jgi:hypothetical protein
MDLTDDDQAHIEAMVGQVREYGAGVTLYALVQQLESRGVDVKGDYMLPTGFENVVLWTGLSEHAAELVGRVIGNPEVDKNPSTIFTYLYDGVGMNLPVANLPSINRGYQYKKLHWMPIELSIKRPKRG